ncbi:MAG: complex I NDUFA9 subunit family protein [Alphaproteobacteria bacterium]
MAFSRVTIFGGSGFIGRYIVERLADRGVVVTVAVRDPEGAKFLRPLGDVGQITPVRANLRAEESVRRAVLGADAVINLVGVLYETGRQTFKAVHEEGARAVARAARDAGASRLVHLSAIGAGPQSASAYARSKAAGEAAVMKAFPTATILRPSIVFGPEDGFFNRFAALARLLPALPLYGGGTTRFQPVYVGDVAAAVLAVLDDPATAGLAYELGGPRVYSFAELMRLTLEQIRRRRLLVPVPFLIGFLQAWFLERAPRPLLTRDQLRQLRADNIVADDAHTLAELGITPTPAETILPTYLDRYRPGGRVGRVRLA